ncbi:helix-turn-helix domain-containing protein [Actinomadura viridis]|uniref:AraC-like DNA-binding protein n=1 Tax=Actinomadura viridis TaxID=58110 RepID=A0A931DKX3_9ACTN|nr:helix-turn-helix domain-containing protein [Actinomadura viridis]MBG6093104.1 AraC-like DNA-binding protein [Actinomadura viridis]
MGQVLSTEQVPPRDRVAYWHEVICSTFIKLDVAQTGGGMFRGMVRNHQIGPIQATRILTDPMTAERSRRHLRSAEEDVCLLALQLRGRTVGRQDGRQAVLEPGDLALFDSTRPYLVDFQGRQFDHLVLQFPRAALRERGIEANDATAHRIAVDSVIGRLVSPFLINATRVADTASAETGQRLAGMALDLVATALAPLTGLDRPPSSPGEELLRRVQLYMQLHLSDPCLSPPKVAAAHNISLRQLHRLFSREGTTFGRWLREERLRRCYDDLGSPLLAGRSIAEIGARWGLPDAPGLSRAFRARYGMSPRERRSAAVSAGSAAQP